MSTNFNTYMIDSKRTAMNVSDLSVGDIVVRIYRPTNSWGVPVGDFRTVDYKVTSILKTRLVLESVDPMPIPSLPGQVGKKSTLRMLLENSRYSTWRAGEVKTDKEGGDNQNYRREPIELATAGDPIIEELRQYYADQKAEFEQRQAAKAAVAEVRHYLDGNPDLAKIEEAIRALQVIADQIRNQK